MIYRNRVSRRCLIGTSLALVPAVGALGRIGGAAAADGPKLTMWFDTTGGADSANCIVKNEIDVYNALGGPQVEATMQANGWDATRTALAGGGGPDIVVTPGPSFAFQLAQAGQVAPLDSYASAQGWASSFVPWALDLGKVDGKLYSIPNEVETLVLYYNKTLFEKQGWTAPKTMDEMIALGKTVKDAGLIPFAHCNQEWRAANEWYVGEFINHVAGPEKVYAALTGTAKWTDPEFVDAITKVSDMQKDGWFMGGLDRYYTTAFADANDAFASGKAAMKIEGTWWMQSDAGTFFGPESGYDSDWDWVPVPSMTGDAIFDLGIGSTVSINGAAKDQDAAAAFVANYFSSDAQAKMLIQCGVASAPVKLTAEQLTGLEPRHAAILTALNDASAKNNYGYTTWTFWPPKTEEMLIEEIEKVWAGDKTPTEYLQDLQTQFDAEKAAGAIPPIPTRS